MKRYFKDFYGSSASITATRDGSFRLIIRLDNGKLFHRKTYATERGARVAMGRMSEGWRETR